jgi:DNA-binding MarR family transcriptional regulator
MTSEPISQLEDHTGYWLRCLSNFVSGNFALRLEGQGVTVAQWVVLRALYGREPMALMTAAGEVGVDASTLSRMVERLVQKGLVERVTDPADRRGVKLSLSDAGAAMVPELARLADDNDAQFFKSLSDEQRRLFLKLIHQLLDANGWDRARRGKDQME